MIVIDTSAIIAIAQREPEAFACYAELEKADILLISAGTLSELLIVASRRSILADVEALLTGLRVETVALTPQGAELAAAAYAQWGKGVHPAGLNICDCFAYVLAMERGCPLLFAGNDFSQTDVVAARL